MTLTLDPGTFEKLKRDHRDDPVLEFWQLTIEQTEVASPTVAVAGVSQPVSLNGVLYYPLDLRRASLPANSDGSIQKTQLTLPNYDRFWSRKLREGFLLGMPAVLEQVIESEIDAGLVVYRSEWTIDTPTVGRDTVTLELTAGGLENSQTPVDRYSRGGCRHAYRLGRCGYDGPIPTCAKTLEDCILHGDEEVSRGLPRLHPQQYGAHPGILRRLV
ncbi:MAG: hypothetical protein AAF196_08945 [Planctomycetota bacterium]